MRVPAYANQNYYWSEFPPDLRSEPLKTATSDVRFSTRRALYRSEKRRGQRSRGSLISKSATPMEAQQRSGISKFPGQSISSQTPGNAPYDPQITRPNTASSTVKGNSSASTFKNTLRRVFSLGSPDKAASVSRTPKRSPPVSTSQVHLRPDVQGSAARPVDRPRSPQMSNITASDGLPVASETRNVRNDTSPRSPAGPGFNRLRRTKSRILRVSTTESLEQTPSMTSFYTPTSPISVPQLPTSRASRSLRPPYSPHYNITPPITEPRRSNETTSRRGSGQPPRRDSLEVQRSRYNHSRGSSKAAASTSFPEETPRRRRPSSSSMNIEVGSMKSVKESKLSQNTTLTAPRQNMEVAGIIARLDDLESRMIEVEDSLRRLKDSHHQDMAQQDSSRRQDAIATSLSQRFHTPPSYIKEAELPDGSFLRESSSPPLTDDESSPSTPVGVAVNPLFRKDHIGEQGSSQKSSPGNVHLARAPEVTGTNILRESLLQFGYDHTLVNVLHAVNSEHNARVALEENVTALKRAISQLRLEVGINTRPGTSGKRSAEERLNYERHPAATREFPLEGFLGSASQRMATQGAREPIHYNELWSQAAVPVRVRQNFTLPDDPRTTDEENYGTIYTQPASRFSFDDTTSNSGGSVDVPEGTGFDTTHPVVASEEQHSTDSRVDH